MRRLADVGRDVERLRQLRVRYGSSIPILDPGLRLSVGGVLLLGGLGIASQAWGCFWIIAMTAAGMGVVLFLTGVEDVRRSARLVEEEERALGEWAVLQQEYRRVMRLGTSVPRMLRRRGYRIYEVRRWIVARLEQELEEELAR